MYTAKLKNRLIESGVIRWVVEFTNGTDVWSESFNVPKYALLENKISKRLEELNFADAFTIDADIPYTNSAPAEKTQAEIDANIWFKDWANFKQATELVNLGIVSASLPAYVSLKTKVTNNFKPVYVTLM